MNSPEHLKDILDPSYSSWGSVSSTAPAPTATAVPVPVAVPVMNPALPVDGDAAPTAGLRKGIPAGIVDALDAFFAR